MKPIHLCSLVSRILTSLVVCFSSHSIAAPFCAVTAFGPSCVYYDVQSCRSAAGPSGACVANTNSGYDSSSPIGGVSRNPPRFIESNPVTDRIRENAKRRAEAQEDELRQLEVERRRRELNSEQNYERPQENRQNAPRGNWADNIAKATEPLILVCNIRGGGLDEEYTVTVDMVNQTANGRKAQISDGYINWEAEAQGHTFHWSVNRFSGLMTISRRGLRGSIQGRCEAFSQADRKF